MIKINRNILDAEQSPADHLRQFLDTLGVPVLAMLRDTQLYVQLAARGATLWDVAPSRAERDLAQWQPIVDWAK